jgi:hypothetical protein
MNKFVKVKRFFGMIYFLQRIPELSRKTKIFVALYLIFFYLTTL